MHAVLAQGVALVGAQELANSIAAVLEYRVALEQVAGRLHQLDAILPGIAQRTLGERPRPSLSTPKALERTAQGLAAHPRRATSLSPPKALERTAQGRAALPGIPTCPPR